MIPNSAIQDLQAIDAHAHYGVYDRGPSAQLSKSFMSGSIDIVAARAEAANIHWTVVSPLSAFMPTGQADSALANEEAANLVDRTSGLLQWVVINPLQPRTFEQAMERFAHPKCMGIKIHPEEHGYRIAEYEKEIFEFAARFDAVIIAHSGQENSLPVDYLPFADAHPNVTLIVAHFGNSDDANTFDLQVRAIQASRHGNIYTDTSSARSLLPGMLEWAVGEVGAEKILFGSDSPLYFTASQRARVDHADLDDKCKTLILRGNTERILRLPK